MFGNIKIADTRIRETSLGVDGLGFVGSWLMYGTAALNHHRTNERTFEQKSHYEFFTMNGAVKKSFENRSFLLGSLRMQKKLGGDDLLTTDYFYLGQTNGVRGYYNDQISGEGGFSVSLEGSYPIYTPRLAAIAFADYGNIWGTTPYGTRHLTSVGTGLTWQPYDWAQVRTTLSVPLNRHPAGADTPNKARFDFSISATY
jgi:hemolysin activation/secretion protein